MKQYLLAATILFYASLPAQIVFEEVPAPNDFSLEAVRKSSTGEYLLQAQNDYGGLYTSPDGQGWIRSGFPVNRMVLDEIRFFNDGTPVLNAESNPHLIRRNGAWHTLRIPGRAEAEASFIKDDTLFAYNQERFAYSVDKGASFTVMFTAAEDITDHTAHLWVSDTHIILHHTAGASDYVSVFDRQGQRALIRSADLNPSGYVYRPCGEILIYDWDRFFLIKLSPFEVAEGNMNAIYPGFKPGMRIQVQGDRYFIADGQTILRTTGCTFNWEPLASSPLIDSLRYFFVDPLEGILLHAYRANSFVEKPAESSEWIDKPIDIDYAYIFSVNESSQGYQAARTPNALFYKEYPDMTWSKGNFFPDEDRELYYAPDGTLYVAGEFGIYSSVDNGLTFDTIPLPDFPVPGIGYDLYVFSNEALFVITRLIDECFYSLDGGLSWTYAPVNFSTAASRRIGLAGNSFILVAWDVNLRLFRIKLSNNETSMTGIGTGLPVVYHDAEVMEDGTVYYLEYDQFGFGSSGLYKCRFGETPEYLGYEDEFINANNLASSRNVLFGFGSQSAVMYDGEELSELEYMGLPQPSTPRFFIAANHHAYAIIGNSRIFRSRDPLTFAQGLTGRIVHDADMDCAPDTPDTGLKGWRVIVENVQQLRLQTTDLSGHYHFNLPQGTYMVSTEPINPNWEVCMPSSEVTVGPQEQVAGPNFQGRARSACAMLDIDFSTPLLRRCFDNSYYIRVRNTGPGASAGTKLRLELDPFFDLISATHPFTMDGESILLFDLGVLEVNAEILVRVVFNLSCDAELGMTHCLGGQLLDDNLCGNERSAYTECQENIGSYDPNDKCTFNAAGRATQTVDKDEYIYYHIRFQNTGTDTAFRVRILDTLSTRLDPRTLEMLSASHPFTHAVNDGPTLEVVFDNIFLPDSNVNEAASHGFFKFRIKPYPQYDYGTMIPNDASIYFDYNDPVITPEALLVLQRAVRTSEPAPSLSFDLTPNPAFDWIVVRPDPDSPVQPDGYRIIDRLGRVVAASTLAGDLRVDVTRLLPGVYHFAVLRDRVMAGGRAFVKL